KEVLVALAAIRRRFPGLGRLAEAMPHHQRQFAGLDRDLVKHAGMVAMERLTTGSQVERVVAAGALHDRSTHGETALFLDHQRCSRFLRGGKRESCRK